MQIVGRTAKVDSAMPAAVEIQRWLEDIGLGRYADVFRDNNIGFSRLRLMSRAELSKLGISSDHQRILLSAAARNGTPIPETAAAGSGPLIRKTRLKVPRVGWTRDLRTGWRTV
jgi:hypothetical protein